MQVFLLLRNNIESGPYTLEELKQAGIWSTDLLWIEGKSLQWQSPDKIEEIKPFVYDTGRIKNDNTVSNFSLPVYLQEGDSPKKRVTNYTGLSSLLQKEGIPNPRPDKGDEKEFTTEGKSRPGDLAEQVSRRSLEIRKSLFSRKDITNSSLDQAQGNNKEEYEKQENIPRDTIKIIIADDHRLFREGVKMALSQKKDISILAEAENGVQLMQQLKHLKPDVILLDIQMPLMDGISALGSIRKQYGNLKVIMLTMHEGHSMVSALMEKGANAYLTKTADPEAIYQAIKTCYTKDFYFNELTNISMLEGLRSKSRIPDRTASPIFDGAKLMRQLTEAQKKSSRHRSKKTAKRLLYACFSILLIAAGITAGKTILGNSQFLKPFIADKSIKPTAKAPIRNPAAAKIVTITSPSEPIQKKTEEIPLPAPEKTAQSLNDKKPSVPKTNKFKATNQLPPPTVQEVSKIDSSTNPNPEAGLAKALAHEEEAKIIARNNIRTLVTASVNNYHKGLFGGISDIRLTLNNGSAYRLDEVIVEIKYLHNDFSIYKTESLNFQNIQPSSDKVMEAPKSSKGVRIEYRILSIKSSELGI